MAIVVTVPRDSALQFRLVVGTNPDTGAPIINRMKSDLKKNPNLLNNR